MSLECRKVGWGHLAHGAMADENAVTSMRMRIRLKMSFELINKVQSIHVLVSMLWNTLELRSI